MYKSEQSPHKKANIHNYSLQSGQKSTSGSISNCREIMIETNDKEIPFISIYKPDQRKQQKGLHVIMSIFTANYRVKMAYTFNCLVLLKKAEQHFKSKVILLSQTLKSIIRRQKAHSFLKLCAKKMNNKLIVEAMNAISHVTTKRKRCNMEMVMHRLSLNKYQTMIDSMQEKHLLVQISQLKEEKISQEIVQKSKILQRVSNAQSYIESLRKCQFQTLLKAQQKRFEFLRSKMTPKRKMLFDNQLFIVVFTNTIKAFQGEYARLEEQLKLNSLEDTEVKHEEKLLQLNQKIESWTHQIKTMDRQVKNTPFSNPNKLIAVFSNHSKQLKTKKQKTISPIEEMIDSRLFLHELILKCLNFCVEQKQAQEANRQFAELVSISNQEHKLANFICTIRQNTLIKTLAQTILMFHKKITEFEADPHSEDSKQEEASKQISKLEVQCQLLKEKCIQLESKYTDIALQLAQEKIKNQKHIQDYTILEDRYKLLHTKCQENQSKIIQKTPAYEINIKQVDEPTPRSISNRQLCQKLNKICIKSAIQLKSGNNTHMMKSTDMMKQLLLIKMQAENQFMSYEKEISHLKRETIQYQNIIDQLQASITHKDNHIRKYQQSLKQGHQTKPTNHNESSLNQQKWREIVKQKQCVIATLIKQKQQKLNKDAEDDRDARIQRLQQKVQQLNLTKRKSLQKQRQLQQNIRAWQEGLSSIQNQLKQKTNIIDKLQKQLQLYKKDNKNLQDTGEKSMAYNLRQKESKDSLSYSEDHHGTGEILGLVYNILLHSKGKIEKKVEQQLWQDLCDVRQSQSSTFYTRLLNFSKQFITKYQK